jgi:hypothetical protein
MTDGELTGVTVNQVQTYCQDDVNADKDNVQFPEGTDDAGKDTALQSCKCCRQESENG